MHVAVVDEWLPYPVDCGKKLRSFHLLAPLARTHRITYLAPRSGYREQDDLAQQAMTDAGFKVVWIEQQVPPNSGLMFAPRLAKNFFSPYPYSVDRHINRQMQVQVEQLDREGDVDLWHAEWTPYVENLRGFVSKPWIINAHNVESLIWQRYRDVQRNRMKAWYFNMQYQRFEAYEQRAFQEASCVVTCTDDDATIARTTMNAENVQVVSNGVDTSRFTTDSINRDHNELLFLGSLAWRPNLDAVKLLLDSIFPAIRVQLPKTRLTIVGFEPPSWLVSRVAQLPNVELYGNAPQVEPFLERAGAMVVPLRIGGGSRIKILEALGAACPVISTAVGAEGLHLQPTTDIVIANTVESFADTTVKALANYRALLQTAHSGRNVVRARYEWSSLAEQLGEIWEMQLATEGMLAV
ncbi:glycosyltransferase [Aeoliella mucimassa]|uniref:Glycosyltransferase subfamily 4-like N-terminal domain-containing protein n=1 Tax=Aeoliella mucimassa TaxID=2527972 RepID=A0A518ALT0_9BACT|nr:glycosyltransferase [Aeoliella mucimassa]QDU55674.1 hypothetical protein Pan181_18670 [Aeoliella mucimassa]